MGQYSFEHNPMLDHILTSMEGPLSAAEGQLLAQLAEEGKMVPERPVILLVGAPRSGTTLIMQWLQATGHFAVPSNLMARFSSAPGLSARIQSVLFDDRFRFGSQLDDLYSEGTFDSDIGKTRGALAPNEYFFFWRRHLCRDDLAPLGDAGVDAVDWGRVRAELAGIETAFGHPVAMKGMMLQYDIGAVAAAIPEALFLFVRRDPFFNAKSLILARERFHGDRSTWWSTRAPGCEVLDARSPEEQVVGQVHLDQRAIEVGLSTLSPERKIAFDYEDFCSDTGMLWRSLRERCEGLPESSKAPTAFEVSDGQHVDSDTEIALREACERAERGELL